MLLSMTGFSCNLVSLDIPQVGRVSLSIEMKSINSRFFEGICKLPNALASLEVKIINELQRKLIRGRVYLTVRFAEDNEVFETIEPSMKTIQAYLNAAETISTTYGLSGSLTVKDIFLLPNIFVNTRATLQEDQEELILDLINKVADQLMKTRAEEGRSLHQDFQVRFDRCKNHIDKIALFFEDLMARLKQNIDVKLAAYQAEPSDQLKIQLDDLYSTINKSDIHEEIIRFKSHLASVEGLINNDQIEKGKRIDFILQELLREINTIMAKCSNFDISSLGVDIKVDLEKAREQVQNVI